MGMWMERARDFLLGDKGRKLIIAGAVAAMVLLLLSTVSCGGKTTGTDPVQTENSSEIEEQLEKRLTELISSVEGVSDVKVMVTLDMSTRRVYEKDERSSSEGDSQVSTEKEVVLAGSGKEPVEAGTIQPKVRGVAIVCGGASDPIVREKVANIAAKALDIGVSRVYVTE